MCTNFASAPCRRVSGGIAQLIIVALVAALAIVPQGFAQTPAPSSLKSEQQALFDRTLKEPANLDVAFRYAEVSTKLHDFEAAIGALERMLFFNANLPRVKLELGVLYCRLGSYEMAKNYFTNAIADPAAPPDMRAKVQAYLDEIEKRLNPNFVSGLVQTGVRYQTNATAGPSGSLIRVFGFDGVLDQKFVKQPDWNFFAQGIVFQTVDLQTQRGDSWETQASAYASEQLKIKRLDVAAVGFQTGHASTRHRPVTWHAAFAQALHRRIAGCPRGGILPWQRYGGSRHYLAAGARLEVGARWRSRASHLPQYRKLYDRRSADGRDDHRLCIAAGPLARRCALAGTRRNPAQ